MPSVIQQDGGLISAGRFYRFTMVVQAPSSQCAYMGIHLRAISGSGLGALTLGQVAKVLNDDIGPTLLAALPNEVNLFGCKLADVSAGPKPLPGQTTDGTFGDDINASMPGQVCGILHTQTDVAGRRGRGRMYVPFPTLNDIDPVTMTPTAAYQVQLGDIATAMFNAFDGVSVGPLTVVLMPIIYHRDLVTFDEIKSAFPRDAFATQRRRGNYGKLNGPPW